MVVRREEVGGASEGKSGLFMFARRVRLTRKPRGLFVELNKASRKQTGGKSRRTVSTATLGSLTVNITTFVACFGGCRPREGRGRRLRSPPHRDGQPQTNGAYSMKYSYVI